MRRSAWWRQSMVGLVLVAACQPHGPASAPVLEGRIGVYHFSERVPSSQGSGVIIFEGEFTVLGDTVMMNATPGPCRYDQHSTKTGGIVYQCGDISVSFDRNKPVERATYSVTVTVTDPPKTCPPGRRNCTPTDAVDHSVVRTGRLTAKPGQ